MSRYFDPQGIWDRWEETEKELTKKSNELKNDNHLNKGLAVDNTLFNQWKATIEELKICALLKFLDIQSLQGNANDG